MRAQTGPGPEGFYLEKINGHCVFLRDDNSCAVHAELGGDRKPAFCREYPFTIVREPRGVVLTVREGCGGSFESSLDGTPLEEHAAAVIALPRAYPVQTFGDHPVALLPGLGVSAADWLHLEERICSDVLAEDFQPDEHIASIRATMLRAVRRDPPSPDPVTAMRSTGAMLQVYRMVLDRAVSEPGADPAEATFARQLRSVVVRALTALPRGVPTLDRAGRSYVSLMLRTQLLGKRFLPHGSVAVGLANFLHNVRTALLAAERTDDGVVTVQAFAAVHTDHVRLTHNRSIRAIQKKARPALVDLFMSV